MTSDYVSEYFDQIGNPLKLLLGKITASKNYFKEHELEKTKYNKDKMIGLNNKVLEYLWPDMDRFRLDVSSHPFTTSFSNNDTRITTWYHEIDFARSLLAVIHEFGHGLYELQSADELEMTPVAGGSSLVIHESQSRYWENHIGRSRNFIQKFKKDFDGVVSRQHTADSYYSYFNKVRPSLLRVEADEVTYHFHIMLRAEIEKGIIEGKLKVKDIPEIWKTKMKEYLGVVPKKPSDGAMQDIHWSGGSVGYFPTYSLGTSLSVNWADKDKNWLKNNIHKYGSTYTLQDMLKRLKMNFDPSKNIEYLQDKYSKIYKFK